MFYSRPHTDLFILKVDFFFFYCLSGGCAELAGIHCLLTDILAELWSCSSTVTCLRYSTYL